MSSIELVGESLSRSATALLLGGDFAYSLMELPSDGLAGKKTALTDQELTTLVERSAGQNDLLGTIFELSTMALLQEAKQEAHEASAQTL